MYKTAAEIISQCQAENKSVAEIVLEAELELQGSESAEEVRTSLTEYYRTMCESAHHTLTKVVPSVSGLSGGNAKKLYEYLSKGNSVCGTDFLTGVAYALSTSEVNASMGLVAAAPTAGSAGILPGALILTVEKFGITDERRITDALLTAGGIGQLIEVNATLSGAEGGCQAECGSAAAMAAGAVVQLLGGTPEQVFHAAAMALKNVMGLVCDPIAGLVECPCIKRNASGAGNAMLCADLALAGIQSFVPFDEVVDAMRKVGRSISPELRETSLGGLAKTPTGKRVKQQLKDRDAFDA